jgi:hypothetical protein
MFNMKVVRRLKQAVVADVMAHIGRHTVYADITLVVLKQK